MCDAHHYLLDTTFTRYGSKLYNQIVGIRMGTNYVPLFAEFFFYERDFVVSHSDNNQADGVKAFNLKISG